MPVEFQYLLEVENHVHPASPKIEFKRSVLVALGWYDPRTIRIIGEYARKAEWHLETRHFFDQMVPAHWQGDGLIISYPQRPDLLAFIRRQATRQPTVLLGRNKPPVAAGQVMEDNVMAGRLAAHHFLERGHTHFAWLSTYPGPISHDRHKGFASAVTEAGFTCHRLEYIQSKDQSQSPLQEWRQRKTWLARQMESLPRPLACYVLDDQLASEAIETCMANGWHVPQDFAVMGTGNISIACECSHVPISSVDVGEETIALEAAKLLDEMMNGRKRPLHPIIVAPRGVVVRASTDFIAVAHPPLRRAVDYVEQNLGRPFSLEQVAEAADISRRSLYTLFKQHLSRSPVEFIIQRRIDQACRVLENSPEITLVKLAAQVGFGSPRTFARLFRQYKGSSLRAWKKAQATANRHKSIDSPFV